MGGRAQNTPLPSRVSAWSDDCSRGRALDAEAAMAGAGGSMQRRRDRRASMSELPEPGQLYAKFAY